MHNKIQFDGNNEIGAYIRITNSYALIGRSDSQNIINSLKEMLDFPIIETTINSTRLVGVHCVGNIHGLLVPDTCTDQELQHIRNSLPPNIKVVRIIEKLNCLGNLLVCNDHVCLAHPSIEEENIKIIQEALKVPVYRMSIGPEPLVGTFSVMNNRGMLTGPHVSDSELKELSDLLKVQVIAGTVNSGLPDVGSGIICNDHVCFTGYKCTNVEVKVAQTIFNLTDSTIPEAILAEEIVL